MNRPINPNGQANGLFQDHDNILLRTLYWNADGLTSDKFTEFKHIVNKIDADIYAIAEAGASTDNEQFFQMNGYQTYILKRARAVASGLVIAAKTSLTVRFRIAKEMTTSDKMEVVTLEVWKENFLRKFIFVYNPPRNQPDLNSLEFIWNSQSILMGDLNAPSTLWGYQTSSAIGRSFEEFISSNPVQFVDNEGKSPTFLSYGGGTSHPDVVLAHTALSSTIMHKLLPSPSGFGHKILLAELAVKRKLPAKLPKTKTKWNLKKADWNLYRNCAENLLTETLVDENIDKSLFRINEVIIKCAKQAIPKGKVRRYVPFWNEELTHLKEERDRARDDFEESKSGEHREILKQKTKILKRKIILSKKETYRNFLKELDFRRDGVRAHKFISKINNDKNAKSKNPFIIGTKEITDDEEIAEHFCKYYAKTSNFSSRKENGSPDIKASPTCPTETEKILMYNDFESSELDAALHETKIGKSPGPDGIYPEFLTKLGIKARKTVLLFLNKVWKSYYPSEWRKAEVIPIPKKGKTPNAAASFRPISLTSVFSKVYERLILRRLKIVTEDNKLISNRQAGFRGHRGTVEQVARLSQEIKDGFHRKQSTITVLIDFCTAFDRVWRKKLLNKLKTKGIKGRMFAAIHSYLAQRMIRVKYQDSTSSYKQIRQGLPQGSVISPILFDLMVDDAIDAVQSIPGVQALLYADDLVVWATSSNISGIESALNKALDRLLEWANANEMLVNPEKSEFQLFTLSTKQYQQLSLKYDSINLPRTNCATYLGVQLDNKLQWSKHIEALAQRGMKRLRLLSRLAGTKWGATNDVLTQAYTAYVRPVLEYGSELIVTASDTSLKKLDKTQNQALRLITGGPRSTPIAAMELQTGLAPLCVRREIAAVCLNERVNRLNIDYWNNRIPPSQRLATQKSFSGKAEELSFKYSLDRMQRADFPKASPDMITSHPIPGRLDLLQPVNKQVSFSCELKAIALATIHERYPSDHWLHIYTDGSACEARRNAGAGVYSADFQIAEPVGTTSSNFDGEVRAIVLTLEQLMLKPKGKAVLLVDSQAAIAAFTAPGESDNNDVRRGKSLYSKLAHVGWIIALQWIPSHCGIAGNEEADKLAKHGSEKTQPQPPLDYGTAKRILQEASKKHLKAHYLGQVEGKQWSGLLEEGGRIPRDLPRSEAVANFRMLTGHDYLQSHLNRIGVVDSPSCVLCGSGDDMVSAHLWHCEALENLRVPNMDRQEEDFYSLASQAYWAARRQMASSQ